MTRLPIRVVKVGGSLFELPDLSERFHRWLVDQAPAHHVLIAGGGELVEQVRTWHSRSPLREGTAHWICIDLMSVTARLLHETLPEFPLVEDEQFLLEHLHEPRSAIFDPSHWLREREPTLQGQSLPETWDVTSDSIAARLAISLQAVELVLLKSSLPSGELDFAALADSGFVDRFLPAMQTELPRVRLVNLRELPHRELSPKSGIIDP